MGRPNSCSCQGRWGSLTQSPFSAPGPCTAQSWRLLGRAFVGPQYRGRLGVTGGRLGPEVVRGVVWLLCLDGVLLLCSFAGFQGVARHAPDQR